jgi:hypothetical protein
MGFIPIPWRLICSSSETFVSFDAEVDLSWTYSIPSFSLGLKALAVAKETYIRINAVGIMCIQHQIEMNRETGRDTFVDFLMLADDTADAPYRDEI